MTHVFAAAAQISPGDHAYQTQLFGMTINLDTVVSTLVAAAIVIALGLFVRAKVTSGVPGRTQLFMETIYNWANNQVRDTIGLKVAPYVVPLAFTLFFFILVMNWFSLIPAQVNGKDYLPPATFDVNTTFALMVFVFVWIWSAGFRRHGFLGYLGHIARGPGNRAFLAPINIISELIANPIALALRLFGNILAGTIMVSVISLLPPAINWIPNAGWKLFDMAIGAIQAFVFALLTIIYFGQSLQVHDEGAAAH